MDIFYSSRGSKPTRPSWPLTLAYITEIGETETQNHMKSALNLNEANLYARNSNCLKNWSLAKNAEAISNQQGTIC